MPKYHKDNLYYCLILFNNEAYVASTRLTTCTSQQQHHTHQTHSQTTVSSSTSFSSHLSTSASNGTTSASNANSSSGSSPSTSSSDNRHKFANVTSKDSIWDDSFSFDNLPLDVKEVRVCLFLIGKPPKFFSASFVNNLKKISGGNGLVNTSTSASQQANGSSKMLDPLLIGFVNIKLDDLMNKGLCEQWYTLQPAVQSSSSSQQSFQSAAGNWIKFWPLNLLEVIKLSQMT